MDINEIFERNGLGDFEVDASKRNHINSILTYNYETYYLTNRWDKETWIQRMTSRLSAIAPEIAVILLRRLVTDFFDEMDAERGLAVTSRPETRGGLQPTKYEIRNEFSGYIEKEIDVKEYCDWILDRRSDEDRYAEKAIGQAVNELFGDLNREIERKHPGYVLDDEGVEDLRALIRSILANKIDQMTGGLYRKRAAQQRGEGAGGPALPEPGGGERRPAAPPPEAGGAKAKPSRKFLWIFPRRERRAKPSRVAAGHEARPPASGGAPRDSAPASAGPRPPIESGGGEGGIERAERAFFEGRPRDAIGILRELGLKNEDIRKTLKRWERQSTYGRMMVETKPDQKVGGVPVAKYLPRELAQKYNVRKLSKPGPRMQAIIDELEGIWEDTMEG